MPCGAFRASAIALIVCLFSFQVTFVFAQNDSENQTSAVDPITAAERALAFGEAETGTNRPVSAASTWTIFRTILTLVLVAAAIYGLVFFLKKASRGGVTAQDPFLKVLASTPLGANRSAHVISVGARAWLVGSAESGVSLISEIDDKEALDAMLLEESRRAAASPSGRFPDFRAMLRRLGMPAEQGTPDPEKIRNRSERLKGL